MRHHTAGRTTEARAYRLACTTDLTDPRLQLVDNLIRYYKIQGVWTKLDWLLLMAAETSQAGLVNVKTPSKIATLVNAPTFTTDRGFTGDGATSYIDIGEALISGSNNALNTASCAGVYVTGQGTINPARLLGTASGNQNFISCRNNAGNETFTACDSTTTDVSQANTGTKLGNRGWVRVDAANKKAFYNGSLTATIARNNTAAVAVNCVIGRSNATYSDDRWGAFYSGGLMSDAEMGYIHTGLNTFLVAIGAA